MTPEPVIIAPVTHQTRPSFISTLAMLFKLRIVALLLFTALGGMILASGGNLILSNVLLLLLTGGMSAAGASALNQVLERNRDGLMKRTRHRPLATGNANPNRTAFAGATLVIGATLIALPFNPALAFFLMLGATIYVGVYTIWLKPRTLTNIVIGGAAGSCAVLSGGAAAGNWANSGVLLLALLVFAWTPTHFWSLALAYRADYARAGFPMLPVQVSPRQSAIWVLIHTGLTGIIALALATQPTLGTGYLAASAVLTGWLWWQSIRLLIKPVKERALALFITSNAWLGLIVVAACAAVLLNYYLS